MPDEHNDQAVDEYQDELNETVDDGSGCAKMWEAMSRMRENDVNRRRFLKVGAASVSIALLGSAPALATDDSTPYEELSDKEARSVLISFQKTKKYERLATEANDRGHRVRQDGAVVARVKGDETYELISLPLASMEADRGYLTMRKGGDNSEIDIAELEYVYESEKRIPTKTITVDATAGMAVQSHELDSHTVSNLENKAAGNEPGDITTQQIDITCDGCTAAIGLICQIGCGAGTAFICGVLTGLGYLVGGGCFAFTQIACGLIAIYGCGGQLDYEEICSDPALNLC